MPISAVRSREILELCQVLWSLGSISLIASPGNVASNWSAVMPHLAFDQPFGSGNREAFGALASGCVRSAGLLLLVIDDLTAPDCSRCQMTRPIKSKPAEMHKCSTEDFFLAGIGIGGGT
jgi:hypothetical protein